MRPLSALAAALLLAGTLAGCAQPSPHATSSSTATAPSTTGTAPAPTGFDGNAALGFVKQVALRPDGSPLYRVPGTPGQAQGAAVLWNATAVPGWSRAWQNFTGADYIALDRSPVQEYSYPNCNQTNRDRLAGLPFRNLLAIHPAADPSAPLLLLGAHWDSQPDNPEDKDPAQRGRPSPAADDGASGVGLMLQLMRTAPADGRLPFSLGLLFIDGEDGYSACYPDAGSLYYAQHPLARPAAFVLLDMVGDPGAVYPKESFSRSSAPALQDLVWGKAQALRGGTVHFTNASSSIDDDHVAFIHAGVPSIDVVDAGRTDTAYGFPPQWDTSTDTVDRLDPAMLTLVGATLLAALADPALPPLLQR